MSIIWTNNGIGWSGDRTVLAKHGSGHIAVASQDVPGHEGRINAHAYRVETHKCERPDDPCPDCPRRIAQTTGQVVRRPVGRKPSGLHGRV